MMHIDCQTCPVRQTHCGDCMVSALELTFSRPLPAPPVGIPLDLAEARATAILVAAGLISRDEADGLTATRETPAVAGHGAWAAG